MDDVRHLTGHYLRQQAVPALPAVFIEVFLYLHLDILMGGVKSFRLHPGLVGGFLIQDRIGQADDAILGDVVPAPAGGQEKGKGHQQSQEQGCDSFCRFHLLALLFQINFYPTARRPANTPFFAFSRLLMSV